MNILPEKKEVTRFCEKDDFDFFNIASKNAKKNMTFSNQVQIYKDTYLILKS